MQTFFPNAGLVKLLDWAFRIPSADTESLWLRLYTNAYNPSSSSVTADFTEAAWGGYSQKQIQRVSWSPAVVSGNSARLTLSAGVFEWTPTEAGPVVQGVYLVGGISGALYAARRLAFPRTVTAGVKIRVTPAITLFSRSEV